MLLRLLLVAVCIGGVFVREAHAQSEYPRTEVCFAYIPDPRAGMRDPSQTNVKALKHAAVVASSEDYNKLVERFRAKTGAMGYSFYGCYYEPRVRQLAATENFVFATAPSVSLESSKSAVTAATAQANNTPKAKNIALPKGCFGHRTVHGVSQIYNDCKVQIMVLFCHTTPGTLYTCPETGLAGPLMPGRAEAVSIPSGTLVRMNACALKSYHEGVCTPRIVNR